MDLLRFSTIINKALAKAGPDAKVLLCYEKAALDEGYDRSSTEGVSDIRIVDDWPLPGESLVNYEADRPKQVVIFYDNHFNLDSSTEPE
jgi:hypothetical protein